MEPVPLTVVPTESEADIIVGLLASAGIESTYRAPNFAIGAGDGLATVGPREILVAPDELEDAKAILAADG